MTKTQNPDPSHRTRCAGEKAKPNKNITVYTRYMPESKRAASVDCFCHIEPSRKGQSVCCRRNERYKIEKVKLFVHRRFARVVQPAESRQEQICQPPCTVLRRQFPSTARLSSGKDLQRKKDPVFISPSDPDDPTYLCQFPYRSVVLNP